ncbi:MAG: GDP-mannose 4,6-dehydratase [Actinobacteria bacterium]|nr:GDP-mannose 4,6-dehydratase [Actinomycetota bacterium]
MRQGSSFLITGGAGFIGRWTVGELLDLGHEVLVLDNLSNGSVVNIEEFKGRKGFRGLIEGDIQDRSVVENAFASSIDCCIHLAAQINVQDSIDDPGKTFDSDVVGTFNLLECARQQGTRFVFVSTCMVFGMAIDGRAIDENYPVIPTSPYAAAKLAGEFMSISYYHGYGLPSTVLRPFNTYGPFQKSSGEGGVISVFVGNKLKGKPLMIYGDGTQTRDFLFVEDCARFIVTASLEDRILGRIINAGSGRDISINGLAEMISDGNVPIQHVPHIHPQSELMVLRCDNSLSRELLGWSPRIELTEGIEQTRRWLAGNA